MNSPNIDKILSLNSNEFNDISLEIFRYQAKNCLPYSKYCSLLGKDINSIRHFTEIPFLPINFFKTETIYCNNSAPELEFHSSGTTGTNPSKHFVAKAEIYNASIEKCFELFFGKAEDFCVIGLLPGYLERPNSSLIYMTNYLMNKSKHAKNGYFIGEFEKLHSTLKANEATGVKTILIGVTYALLDFAEAFPIELNSTIVIETGGMKGKRKEIIREELHEILKSSFGKNCTISSEYGMTEILSQAWFKNNTFYSPPWMKILIRDKTDPLALKTTGNGGINIIDLANVYSCSFIETGDAGKVFENSSFEILGRMTDAEIRGCNLMYDF